LAYSPLVRRAKVTAADTVQAVDPEIPRPSLKGRPERVINGVCWVASDEKPAVALTAYVGSISFRAVYSENGLCDVEDRIHTLPERATPLHVFGNEKGVRNTWILNYGLPMLDFVVHPGNSGNNGLDPE
jgi:hypothetical protein